VSAFVGYQERAGDGLPERPQCPVVALISFIGYPERAPGEAMSTTTGLPEHVLSPDPSEQDGLVELREQLARIAGRRRRPVARLVSPEGIEVEIPSSAFAALQAIVRDMAQGLTITLIPHDKELTTKEAADVLNVSRPFLVKLLDRGEMPYHRVGTHRRLNVEDVLAYRDLRAKRRREKLRELTELSEQIEGGYR
jgi:excisionase family DNA binding protein